MKKIKTGLLLDVFTLACSAHAALMPTDLRCDYAVSPLGVDSQNPRLFWKLAASGRSRKQTAYQILVASSERTLTRDHGDLWDSGKVDSDETLQIAYAGAA